MITAEIMRDVANILSYSESPELGKYFDRWGKPSDPPTEPGWYYVQLAYGINAGRMQVAEVFNNNGLQAKTPEGAYYPVIEIRGIKWFGPVPMPVAEKE
jgi:hypothetical protein